MSEFKMIKPYYPKVELMELLNTKYSFHLKAERFERMTKVFEDIFFDEIHQAFLVDKGHAKGREIHVITKNAILLIFNEKTLKLVTVFKPRKKQVQRLYKQSELDVPIEILKKTIDWESGV